MKKNYFIQWKSKVNGRAGKGSKFFDHEEARQLVEELNREYPQIHHEMVRADAEGETIPSVAPVLVAVG